MVSAIVAPLILALTLGRREHLLLRRDVVVAKTTLLGLALGRELRVRWKDISRVDVVRMPNGAWSVGFSGGTTTVRLSSTQRGAAWIRSYALSWARDHAEVE